MPLVVRRVRVADVPVLEALEAEACKRFPARRGWLETYRRLVEATLRDEPEGLLVADFDGRTIGGAIVRQRGLHPVSGATYGHLEALTVAPGWFDQGVHERLLKEAEGRVEKIRLDPTTYQAIVTLRIDRGFEFTTDTIASILTSGLLGEVYIGLDAGGDTKMLGEGGRIAKTQSAVVLEKLIGQFLFDKAGSSAK